MLFDPPREKIKEAETLFLATKKHSITVHKGVVDLNDLPDLQVPEVF